MGLLGKLGFLIKHFDFYSLTEVSLYYQPVVNTSENEVQQKSNAKRFLVNLVSKAQK